MGMIRDSFVLFKNWADAINALPEEYQLETYKALVEYGTTGNMPKDLSPVTNAMLISFSVGMENSICRYSTSIENGKRGGRPKTQANLDEPSETQANLDEPSETQANLDEPSETQANLDEPSETQANLDEPNPNLNVNVNVNDNIKKEINKEKSSKPPSAPKGGRDLLESLLTSSGLSEQMQEELAKWLAYKKYAYTEIGLRSLLAIARKYANAYGERAIVELIEECMASTYKGIIWDKLGKPSNIRPSNMPKKILRTYDD